MSLITNSSCDYSAHPKNDYMHGKTFLVVEREVSPGNWKVEYTDADYCTRMKWQRKGISESLITIEWHTDKDLPIQTNSRFRIRHFGNSKDMFEKISPYSGTSATFIMN